MKRECTRCSGRIRLVRNDFPPGVQPNQVGIYNNKLALDSLKAGIHDYPLYLLIGIVLNTFLVDAVSPTLAVDRLQAARRSANLVPAARDPARDLARGGDDVLRQLRRRRRCSSRARRRGRTEWILLVPLCARALPLRVGARL